MNEELSGGRTVAKIEIYFIPSLTIG